MGTGKDEGCRIRFNNNASFNSTTSGTFNQSGKNDNTFTANTMFGLSSPSCSNSSYLFKIPINLTGSGPVTSCNGTSTAVASEDVAFKVRIASGMLTNQEGYNNLLITIQSDLSANPTIYYTFRTGRIPNGTE